MVRFIFHIRSLNLRTMIRGLVSERRREALEVSLQRQATEAPTLTNGHSKVSTSLVKYEIYYESIWSFCLSIAAMSKLDLIVSNVLAEKCVKHLREFELCQ